MLGCGGLVPTFDTPEQLEQWRREAEEAGKMLGALSDSDSDL